MADAAANSGAPACGLYICVPDDFSIEDMVEKLRQVFFAAKQSSYDKHMHVLELPQADGSPESEINIRALIAYAKHSGFVTILRQNHKQAVDFDADGVLVNDLQDIGPARESLGDERIVGLRCGDDRDVARRGLDIGVDYVIFPDGPNLLGNIGWWTTQTDHPVLPETPLTNNNCAPYVRAGATFINATHFLFTHPKGQMQATVDMLYAIDLALKGEVLH